MIEQVFNVATEFKFDIGKALVNTQTLTNAVDDLSAAASSGFKSLNFLAGGLVAHLGLGAGGLLGVLTKAVTLAEDFDHIALNFSGTMVNNMSVLEGTIHTFNDRLETSKMILEDISDIGIKFAIPSGQLAALTNLLAPSLARRGKLGRNFSGGINMAKNLILGADSLQLNPHTAGEALQRSISGEHMPLPGKLFQRLVGTDAFRKAGIGTQQKFMGLDAGKKIDLLDKALSAVAGDSEMLNHRLGTLHGQMTILRNMFTDIGTVLRPIGDAIRKPLVKVLTYITDYLKTHGKELGQQVGKLIGNIIEDPKQFLISLLQLKALGKDFKKSMHLIELLSTFRFIAWILTSIGVTFNGGLIRALFTQLWVGFMFLARLIPWSGLISGAFGLLRTAFMAVVPELMAILFFFQIISRARAVAKVNDAKNWLELTPKLAGLLVRLKVAFENIMMPINMAIKFWSDLIAPLFETSTLVKLIFPLLDFGVKVLEVFGKGMIYFLAIVQGALAAFFGMLLDVKNFKWQNLKENFLFGFDDFIKANQARLGEQDIKATAHYVTNIGTQNVRFDMREQLEPDRIAFAVTEHLKRLASNPTQGRGNTFRKISAGSLPVAGAK